MSLRYRYFTQIPSWWGMNKDTTYKFVANPPVLSYHSREVIEGIELNDLVMSITLSEFFVLSIMYFLSAAEAGFMYLDSSDPWLSGNTGILMTLGPDKRNFIVYLGFLNTLSGFQFPP